MNWSKIARNIFIVMIVSFILGFASAFWDIHLSPETWIVIFVLAFLILFGSGIYNLMNPTRFLSKGMYNKAIEEFNNIINKYKGNDRVMNAMNLNIASCYSRLGDFQRSIEYLDKIDSKTRAIDKNLTFAYSGLYVVNLMLLDREYEKIEEHLKKVVEINDLIEFYPIRAYFEALKADEKKTLDYIEKYQNRKENRKFILSFMNTSLVFDKFTIDVENNFFIGMSYYKLNDFKSAILYLSKIINYEYDNFYSRKAREILEEIKK